MIKIERSLRSLLTNLQAVDPEGFENLATDLQVSGLTLDSRAVKDGMLFIALNGTQTHGLHYALKAQQQGAVAILWESDTLQNLKPLLSQLHIPVIEITNLSAKLGEIALRYYQTIDQVTPNSNPNYGLKIVGVTGTDGKTTVSHFFAQAMNLLMPDKTAIIGTLGIGFTDHLQQATHTTPDVLTVHKTLRQLASEGVNIVAMEVSSHALDQGRVDGVEFTVAILTNLTRDHLDYHGTLEHYANAKEKLFLRPELSCAVLNAEDDFSQQIENSLTGKERNHIITRYAIKSSMDTKIKAELIAEEAQFTHRGIQATLSFGTEQGLLNVTVLGLFNLSNLLATLVAMLALDISFNDALSALNKVKTVPGRMEKIEAVDRLVVVDYAHTPAALESVLKALRHHTTQRIICVFGCGGNRDKGKRPLMATIAEQYADKVIVTDDNPRTEDPQQIMQDIKAGFKAGFKLRDNIMIEHSRAKAIRLAIGEANAGDVVLIAGKGHEQVQIFANVNEDFDDRKQAAQALQELQELQELVV